MKEDAPFILVAMAFHGLLVLADPGIIWKASAKAPEKVLEVGFVAAPPVGIAQTRAPLAPGIAPGGDSPEPVAAAPAAPAAPASAPAKPKAVKKSRKTPQSPEAIARRLERTRVRAERAAALAELKAEQLAARVRAKAERDLVQARRREELRRLADERREALARAREERRRLLAEARAQETARKAEISKTLAELPAPDVALSVPEPEAASGRRAKGGDTTSVGVTGDTTKVVSPTLALGEILEGGELRDSPNAGGGTGRPASGTGVELEIEGSAAGRRLLNRPTPRCPDWVSRRGLEVAVAVRFVVLDSGEVKEGILVTQTSGFPEIDKLVLSAVRGWKFERLSALAGGRGKLEQWGLVTFKFVG